MDFWVMVFGRWGLDMRVCWVFEGSGWEAEGIRTKSNGNIQSLRPSDFAQAFGRAVAASRGVLERPKAEALSYLEATTGKTDRVARWPTLATMKPSRRWGTQILDVGHPAYSKREMATRRSVGQAPV